LTVLKKVIISCNAMERAATAIPVGQGGTLEPFEECSELMTRRRRRRRVIIRGGGQ